MSLARRVAERKAARAAGLPEPARPARPSAERIEEIATDVAEKAVAFNHALGGLSLAARKRAHVAGVAAVSAAANDNRPAEEDAPAPTADQLMLAKLGQDMRALKGIESIERKIEHKRSVLPDYLPYIDGWLQGVEQTGRATRDEVVMTLMMWLIDCGEYELALVIADVALRFDLALPERYARSLVCAVTEEIAEAALTAFDAPGRTFPWEILSRVEQLSTGRDMPDQVRAKLFKALGQSYLAVALVEPGKSDDERAIAGQRRSACELALTCLRRALDLNVNSGVKKLIEKADRLQRQLEPKEPNPPAPPG